jgi:17 kDa outer membrane surface antigen
VTGLAPSTSPQRLRYRGRSRPWHPALRRLPVGALLLVLGLAAGGCSFSYQLDSLFAKKDDGRAERTGSLRSPMPKGVPEPPAEADLAIARAAVSEVLAKGGKDTSMPWENPHTGARGTITPLTSAYTQDGATCRDFLASYVKNGAESWLQGEACRAERGKWEVRSLRPWKKT